MHLHHLVMAEEHMGQVLSMTVINQTALTRLLCHGQHIHGSGESHAP